MARPGWYPDPAGIPATFRYWDGRQWSAVTTSDPSSSPPDGGMPPPPPHTNGDGDQPSAGAGGYASGMPPMPPTSGGPSSGGRGKIVFIVVAVLLVLILIAVAGILGLRATFGGAEAKVSEDVPATGMPEGGDQLVPPPDESSPPGPGTAPPGPAECRRGAPTMFDDQAGSDRITSHGLSVPRVDGYRVDPLQSFAFTWAADFVPQVQTVQEGWASVYGVGAVETTFGTPEETAEAVVDCMTKSPLLYSGFESRKDLTSEEVDVPGAESAWSITTEIRVDSPGITVDGDVARVIVVDNPDTDVYGLFISVVPIGDRDRIAQQEEVSGQLRVE